MDTRTDENWAALTVVNSGVDLVVLMAFSTAEHSVFCLVGMRDVKWVVGRVGLSDVLMVAK